MWVILPLIDYFNVVSTSFFPQSWGLLQVGGLHRVGLALVLPNPTCSISYLFIKQRRYRSPYMYLAPAFAKSYLHVLCGFLCCIPRLLKMFS